MYFSLKSNVQNKGNGLMVLSSALFQNEIKIEIEIKEGHLRDQLEVCERKTVCNVLSEITGKCFVF